MFQTLICSTDDLSHAGDMTKETVTLPVEGNSKWGRVNLSLNTRLAIYEQDLVGTIKKIPCRKANLSKWGRVSLSLNTRPTNNQQYLKTEILKYWNFETQSGSFKAWTPNQQTIDKLAKLRLRITLTYFALKQLLLLDGIIKKVPCRKRTMFLGKK